jgi:PTH1 family peptidyl-tRNA hydrolase
LSDYLLVGLGNPGKEYVATRHNFGFLAASYFAQLCQVEFVKSVKYRSLIGSGTVDGKKIHIVLPLTYMNASGAAVKAVVSDKGIDLDNALIVCDDFHLPFGDIRIRPKGSDGGHNGLASILETLQTQDVPRLRLGIGAPGKNSTVTDFVLSGFKAYEKKQLDEIIARAADCCRSFFTLGINATTVCFNKRSNQEEEHDK